MRTFVSIYLIPFLFAGTSVVEAASVQFDLLTWDNARATAQLPSAQDVKPAAGLPAVGDWLIFTQDDAHLPAGYNPAGALSHNFVDMTGVGGPGFNQGPSLTGSLTLEFSNGGASQWNVAVTDLAYTGQATPVMQMNQRLVTPGSPAAQNPAFNVDGVGNQGTWAASPAGNWRFESRLDFYFATNADGDPAPADVDAAFNDKLQQGYLIPVSQLTSAGLAGLALDDPAGFFAGDFGQYLLDEIAPRLPDGATYLLITQMAKTSPDYTESGLPITAASLIGNTTFAYTTAAIPEPASILLVGAALAVVSRRRRNAA